METYCIDHEIEFDSVEKYENHKKECEKMQEVPNICTHVLSNGKCCKSSYRHVSSLILHYEKRHKIFACAHCYKVYNSKKELEAHEHPNGINYRGSQ